MRPEKSLHPGLILHQFALVCLGSQLLTAAGGIRRSLDFPEFTSVNPGSHQGTSILVTNPKIYNWPGACFPNILSYRFILIFH